MGDLIILHRGYDGETECLTAEEFAMLRGYSPGAMCLPAANIHTFVDTDAGDLAQGVYKTLANVNVRSGPSQGADILQTLNLGEIVQVAFSQNAYAMVTLANGVSGWIAEQYLGATGAAGAAASAAETLTQMDTSVQLGAGRYKLIADGVNLRQLPALDAPVFGTLHIGDEVDVSGQNSGGFAQVTNVTVETTPGFYDAIGVGWIAGQFLEAVGPAANVSPPLALFPSIQISGYELKYRTIVAAWAAATGLSDFGSVSDYLPTDTSANRFSAAITEFQKWKPLVVNGTLDDSTKAALDAWKDQQTQGGGTTPQVPSVTTPPPMAKPTTTQAAEGGGLGLAILAAAAYAFLS